MANFYCKNHFCGYGFTNQDISLEDKFAGHINCPVCLTSNEVIGSSQFPPAEQAILDLTEQVATLTERLDNLSKYVSQLTDISNLATIEYQELKEVVSKIGGSI